MLKTRVSSIADLSPAEIAQWDAWQAAQPMLASPYFCHDFIRVFADHNKQVEVAIIEEHDEVVAFFPYQRSSWNVAMPVGGALSDFHGVIGKPGLQLDLLPILADCGLVAWDYRCVPVEQARGETAAILHHSHYLDLTDGFTGYCLGRKRVGSETVEKTQRKERALARSHSVRFELDNRDPALLRKLIDWKHKQNVELGVVTPLGSAETNTILQSFQQQSNERLGAKLSVLWIDDEPATLSYTLTMPQTAHCWFLGFNDQFHRSSPGLIQLLKLAESFSAQGIKRFHLGKGNERFKTSLATGHLFLMEGTIGKWGPTLFWLKNWRRAKNSVKSSPLAQTVRWMRPVREWFIYGRLTHLRNANGE